MTATPVKYVFWFTGAAVKYVLWFTAAAIKDVLLALVVLLPLLIDSHWQCFKGGSHTDYVVVWVLDGYQHAVYCFCVSCVCCAHTCY